MSSPQPTLEQRHALLAQLATLVHQCESRFFNRYELATEFEQVVADLCACLEQIFSHGLKNQTTFLNKAKILNGIISSKSKEVYFWNFLSSFLTEHEVQRFVTLRNVHSDFGRGRAWLRNALNEHSLEKYISMIIEDKANNRKQFYSEGALLLEEHNFELISAIQSLNSILFALNIDNPNLDVNPSADSDNPNPAQSLNRLVPVKKSENTVLVRANKKKSNFITINDEEMTESDVESDIYARSAPVPSFMAAASPSSSHVTVKGNHKMTEPKLISPTNSSLSISDNMVLIPIYDEDSSTPVSTANSAENNRLQQLQGKVDSLEQEREKILRDNSLLKIQLNKYCAAIELLKYNRGSSEEASNATNTSNRVDESIEDYEKKLVQVAEMHGELVEFNEHLYRIIQQKDSIISRLRDELIELRGPLPDSDEIMSIISSEAETHSHSLQSLPQPLIHVWIPTAFLSGGFKGKSHHIYQIYIRIKEEEWNVYRRYSQFYALHKFLKDKHSCISDFEFPPKKAIGNKDSKVVQERRKKLEFYLRNVLNYVQTQYNDLSNKQKLISILPFLSDKFIIQDRSHSMSDSNLNTQPQSSQHYMGF